MKRIMTFAFALTIAAALALTTTSCSNEDILTENNEQPQVTTNGVQVTVDAGFDEASTRSAVADDGTKRALKFTTGDQLYVYGEINAATSVAGYLTMVGSPTNDDKSAMFRGTVKAYKISGATPVETTMPAGEDPLALCNHKTTKATLVHKDLNAYAISITEGKEAELYTGYISAADVNTLMTTGLPVQGDYISASKSFTLSSTSPIFNCTISGLTASTTYSAQLKKDAGGSGIVSFQTDANGVGAFAFGTSLTGSGDYRIEITDINTSAIGVTIGTINLGSQNLTAKVYNVRRHWNGTAFASIIPLANVLSCDVGKVIGADGNIYANATAATNAPTPTTAVAMIAYVGTAGSVETGNATFKGLAIAMSDANDGNTCQWFTDQSGTCTSHQTSDEATVITYKDGIANTTTLVGGCGGTHTHSAACFANNNNSTSGPTGTSGWFLPSIGQWNLIVQGLTGGTANLRINVVNDTYKATNVNAKIIVAGGTGLKEKDYWSCSEYSSTSAWFIRFSEGNINGFAKNRSTDMYVRSVLAF